MVHYVGIYISKESRISVNHKNEIVLTHAYHGMLIYISYQLVVMKAYAKISYQFFTNKSYIYYITFQLWA